MSLLLTQYHELNGLKYQDVWDFQALLHNSIKYHKLDKATSYPKAKAKILNHLVFCEHYPVITMGKSTKINHLVSSEADLDKSNIELFKINRGGDITYHGPGQITGYLIFDVELLYRDVHRFVREIEACIIRLLAKYDIIARRLEGYTGVWVEDRHEFRKICAIGIHLSRWVSMHGFALNVNTLLDHFNHIVPCGIDEPNKAVTSMANELQSELIFSEVQAQLKKVVGEVFGLKFI